MKISIDTRVSCSRSISCGLTDHDERKWRSELQIITLDEADWVCAWHSIPDEKNPYIFPSFPPSQPLLPQPISVSKSTPVAVTGPHGQLASTGITGESSRKYRQVFSKIKATLRMYCIDTEAL